MPTDEQLAERVRPGLRFRFWYQLFKQSDGWYAKGQYVRATLAQARRRAARYLRS